LPRVDRLLLATVGLQWLVTVGVALTASRSGSVYGDLSAAQGTVDAAGKVAHGTLPATAGPLYPLLISPLASLTTRLETISSIVAGVNIVVLGPVASYCFIEVARRIAGRVFASVGVAVWLLGPIASVQLFKNGYRSSYVDGVLPTLYGLTLDPVYLAMTLSLVAAVLALRAAAGAPRAAFVAGLVSAAAIACVPVAAGIATGAIVALAAARRWRSVIETAVGLAAGVAPTLIWRHRALVGATVTLGHPSWARFQGTMASVREYFWSNRLLQWIPVAGTVGMARLMRPAAALAAGWFATATLIVIATGQPFERGQFFIELIPAWPAYALLAAAIPALVPTLVRRLGSRVDAEAHTGALSKTAAASVFALVVLVPVVLAALVGR
jgi:hypothetical protein